MLFVVDNRSELNAVFDLVHPAPPTSPWGSSSEFANFNTFPDHTCYGSLFFVESHRTCEPSLPPDKFHPYVPGCLKHF